MIKKIFILLSLLTPTHWVMADSTTGLSKDALGVAIHDYLMKNPEIIMKMDAAIQSNITKIIFKDKNIPQEGPRETTNNTVQMVEIMDYSCAYCKKMWPEDKKLLKKYPNLAIKFVNIPILGDYSTQTSLYSNAIWINYPKKWFAFHDSLMSSTAKLSDTALSNLMKKLGIDEKKIKQFAASQQDQMMVRYSLNIAARLGLQGTPYYIVGSNGKYQFPGAVGYDQLNNAIQSVEKEQKSQSSIK